MMATMRKLIDNKVYKFILWTFLFMMAVGSGFGLNKISEKKWVIKVYDETLIPAKFENLLKREKAQKEYYRQKGIVLAEKSIEKDAIKSSVANLLNENVLSTMNAVVPNYVIDQEVKKLLSQLPQQFFKPNGELNEEVFARQISPLTIDDFFNELLIGTQNKLLSSIIDESAFLPEFEINLSHTIEFAKKDYSVMKLNLSKYINKAKENAPSDNILEKFYKNPKNNEQFKTSEKRAGIFWKFNPENYNVSITDNDIKKDYEKNKNKYLIEPSQMQLRILLINAEPGKEEIAREKIEKIQKEAAKSPEEFVNLVKEYSDDKDAKKTGGLTNLFTQNSSELDKNIISTAFESLITDGQISTPIKTINGYELLQRVKKNPAKYKSLQSISGEIKENLKITKFKQRFTQDANRAITGARYNPEALEKLITKGDKSIIQLTTISNEIKISQLFKIEEKKFATFFDKDNGIIIQCTTIEKSRIPELSEIKDAVLAKYYEQEGAILLSEALSKALAKIRSGENMETVAKEFDAKIESAQAEFKNSKIEQSQILNNKQVQSKLKSLLTNGSLTSAIADQSGIIIRLNNIEKLKQGEFLKEKETFTKTLFSTKKYAVKDGFIASLYRRAKLDNKIEMKPEILQFLKEA